MKILFTGGGTGGHIFPIVAIAREIRTISQKKDLEFYYLGPKDDFSSALLQQEDFKIKRIVSGKIRRYFSLQNFVDILLKIPFGVIQSFFMLLAIKPDLVFSKGGSGSIAVTYSARFLNIPVFLHE
jgi:UDP-N-acetylglucosamine--N-acetylmuramyl-(pentapeptide) pyrophosphoryl-undecaprenol N-acetylglucosamine transferase